MENLSSKNETNPRFLLKVWKDKEELWDGPHLIIKGSCLTIASELLKNCYSLIERNDGMANEKGIEPSLDWDEWKSYLEGELKAFYKAVLGSSTILDEPVGDNISLPGRGDVKVHPLSAFNYEVNTLCHLVNAWFNPRFKKEHPQYLSASTHFNAFQGWRQGDHMLNIFISRCDDLKTSPAFEGDQLITSFRSGGLLPLAWAEVWIALQNGLRAGVCPYCGKVYIISPNTPTRASCGGNACKRVQIKRSALKNHGLGYEGTRKKKRDSSRSAGRPKSPLAIEAEKLSKDGYGREKIAEKLGVKNWQVNRWLDKRPET